MSDRLAVISIGTNSTRYLIADFSAKRYRFFGQPITRVLAQRSVGTRVGEGLQEAGFLGEAPIWRTLDAVESHLDAMAGQFDRLYAIATSALRRAANAHVFTERVRALTSVPLRVLSGDEEARCAFRGAVMSIPHSEEQRFGVLDTGGGSTEYGVGDHDHAERVVSCETGAVRLTEAFPKLAEGGRSGLRKTIEGARESAREMLAPLASFEAVHDLAVVGGTATTTCSLIRGNRGRFSHMDFTRSELEETFERLVELPLRKRRRLAGMNPQRADILPAGMIVLDAALELTGHDRATVSTTDMLFGFLLLEHEGSAVL
ncbi:MAG: hypothetical protein JOZ38_08195 [Candidatus Eremiobacteraeota bacterium]|nr:hypothetical protein [Candidatus Eremiobacteraeota bacterium]